MQAVFGRKREKPLPTRKVRRGNDSQPQRCVTLFLAAKPPEKSRQVAQPFAALFVSCPAGCPSLPGLRSRRPRREGVGRDVLQVRIPLRVLRTAILLSAAQVAGAFLPMLIPMVGQPHGRFLRRVPPHLRDDAPHARPGARALMTDVGAGARHVRYVKRPGRKCPPAAWA